MDMVVNYDAEIDFFDRKVYKYPTKMLQAHFHEKHELYFLERGKTKYFIGNEVFLLEPGDMIFVPKGIFHKTDNQEQGDIERFIFSFDDDAVDPGNKKYIEELKAHKLVCIPKEKVYKIQNILRQTEKEQEKKEHGYLDMRRLFLNQVLILMSRYSAREEKKLSETYMFVQNIAKFISENYNQNLSLEYLSQKYAVSPSYLSRLFRQITGVGLNKYINISRITAAEKLLLDSEMNITKIATECGFNDSNYFATVFKEVKGITPKKYSKLNKVTK